MTEFEERPQGASGTPDSGAPEAGTSEAGTSETGAGRSGGDDTPLRKDRLIQTRVDRELNDTLKREAHRRRTTVSHLIRSVLEDSFELVDDVVANVDEIVNESVGLARQVGRDARRIADTVREAGAAAQESVRARRQTREHGDDREPGAGRSPLDAVYAWNEVVLNRPASCSACTRPLARGERAHTGLSDDPSGARPWLCGDCIDDL